MSETGKLCLHIAYLHVQWQNKKRWPEDPETQGSTGPWRAQPDWQACARENQFLRQQDSQLSPPEANQTHCAEARGLQSISNAYNEKHILFSLSASEKIISRWTDGSTGPLCEDVAMQIIHISISRHRSVGRILQQGNLQTCGHLTQLRVCIFFYLSFILPYPLLIKPVFLNWWIKTVHNRSLSTLLCKTNIFNGPAVHSNVMWWWWWWGG